MHNLLRQIHLNRCINNQSQLSILITTSVLISFWWKLPEKHNTLQPLLFSLYFFLHFVWSTNQKAASWQPAAGCDVISQWSSRGQQVSHTCRGSRRCYLLPPSPLLLHSPTYFSFQSSLHPLLSSPLLLSPPYFCQCHITPLSLLLFSLLSLSLDIWFELIAGISFFLFIILINA